MGFDILLAMAAGKSTKETVPMAFINGAQRFAWAADELHKLITPGQHDPRTEPVYVLMAHAIELAFKGYLRAHGWSTARLAQKPYRHNLHMLFTTCEQEGLTADPTSRQSINNVTVLLDRSNKEQGLRYFTYEGQGFPEITWGVETMHLIVKMARDGVLSVDPDADKPKPAVKLNITFGKPRPK